MKILNIFDFVQLPKLEQSFYLGGLGIEINDVAHPQPKYKIYLKILSEPFEPEMITRLFEGWEIPDMGNGMRPVDVPKYTYYQSSDSSIGFPKVQIPPRQRFMETEKGTGNEAKCYGFPLPRTLHDFIVNCQQAGIGLQAKKGGWSELR